jgi:hypothetical protein
MTTVIMFFFFSVFVFASFSLLFDMEYYIMTSLTSLDRPVFSSVYFTIITLTTIGYGDYSPQSAEGRFLTMMAALWSVILLSFYVTVFSGVFSLNEREVKAIDEVDYATLGSRFIMKSFHFSM